MGYVYLGLTILVNVAGCSALTASDGLKKKGYAISGVLLFVLTYVILSRAILTINISIAYAIFSGIGLVLSSVISMVVFQQKMTRTGIVCMILILIACVIIHMFGSM